MWCRGYIGIVLLHLSVDQSFCTNILGIGPNKQYTGTIENKGLDFLSKSSRGKKWYPTNKQRNTIEIGHKPENE